MPRSITRGMNDGTPPHIGLVGLARSGKDTVARLLTEHGYRRMAFADTLKQAALQVDPIVSIDSPTYGRAVPRRLSEVLEEEGSWDAAKEVPEVRRFLQSYGVTIRDLDPDFWVRAALRDLPDPIFGPREPLVFTDVRFPNEVDAVRRRGGIIVLLKRPGAGLEGSAGAHASEALAQSDDLFEDVVLHNDGSLDDLSVGVEALVNALPSLPLP